MKQRVLKVHTDDNVLVALIDLEQGETVIFEGEEFQLKDKVQAKHKFAINNLQPGDEVTMYGVLVGKAQVEIPRGGLISTENLKHAASSFTIGDRKTSWNIPDVSKFQSKKFYGFYRPDGSVGTANYWLVIPMVFCENRNLEVLEEALVKQLGYGRNETYANQAKQLINMYKSGSDVNSLLSAELSEVDYMPTSERLFPNVDGVKFLKHAGGCGGTRSDAQALCALLAGYITQAAWAALDITLPVDTAL